MSQLAAGMSPRFTGANGVLGALVTDEFDGGDHDRTRPVWRGSLWVGTAGAALIAAFFALPTGGLAQTLVFVLAAFAAPAVLALRLGREGLLGARPWVYLVAGSGMYALATSVWALMPLATGQQLPFPSPVDGGYFLSYLLCSVFLVGLLHRRHRRWRDPWRRSAIGLVDAAIFALATAAIFWATQVRARPSDPDVADLTDATALGYPLLTAAMAGLVIWLAISGRKRSTVQWLLLVWAVGELIGDVGYSYLSATGGFYYGHPISVMWLLSYVALGALASHPDLLGVTDGDDDWALVGPRLWAPLGAVLVPLGLGLVADSLALDILTGVAVVLAIARLRLISGDLAKAHRVTADLDDRNHRLEHESLHDGLTGLPNRSLFTAQLELAWAHHQRHGRGLVVLNIDLDGFKLVNDRYGHQAGDELLVEAAERMRRCLRDSDTCARLGGDEFASVLPEADLHQARKVAKRLQGELTAPLIIGDNPISLQASIGIAAADPRQDGPDELLHEADLAMYAAKAAGTGRYAVYVPGLEATSHVTLTGVVSREARGWADYVRRLRLEIDDRKLSGEISRHTRAPAGIHRTLEQLLTMIDRLDTDADEATLALPRQPDLEEFVYHHTAVQHWADALVAQDVLATRRTPLADRFWRQLERQALPASDPSNSRSDGPCSLSGS